MGPSLTDSRKSLATRLGVEAVVSVVMAAVDLIETAAAVIAPLVHRVQR